MAGSFAVQLNGVQLGYIILIAIVLIALVYMALVPFKRRYQYAFIIFLILGVLFSAGGIWVQFANDSATYISRVWWLHAFNPNVVQIVLLSTVVFLYLYPKPTRIQKTKLTIPYVWLVIWEGIVFFVPGALYTAPGRLDPTGWQYTLGWLAPYFRFFGFNLGLGATVGMFLGLFMFAEVFRRYRAQKSPLVRRQMAFLLLGVSLWVFMSPLGPGISVYAGTSLASYVYSSGELLLLLCVVKQGFYRVTPIVETGAASPLSSQPSPRLEEGQSYLGIDSAKSLRIFADLVKGGRNGLCMTRTPPHEVRRKYGLESTPIRWLADSENREAINPADLAGMAITITRFIQKAERPITMIDGLDYLVSSNGFRPTMSFLERINKMNAQRSGIFIAASSVIPATDEGLPTAWKAFEEAPLIQARVRAPKTVEIGDTAQFQFDLFNVGTRPVQIDSIENAIPSQFKVVDAAAERTIRGASLLFEGKRLEPFQLESSTVLLQACTPGDVTINAKVAYRDSKVAQSFQSVEPLRMRVVEPQGIEFEAKEASDIFSYLGREFVGDYMLRRQTASDSGWRTLVQVSKSTRVPQSTLYGEHGRYGRPIHELTSRGLVEERRFAEGRGRTGETTKFRVAYDRDAVKHFVDRLVAKPK